MTFAEVLERSLWGEVEAELLYSYPDAESELSKFEKVFRSLLYLTPVESSLRIVISEAKEAGELPEVSGRDDANNSEDSNSKGSNSEGSNSEDIDYALDFQPWDEWLGMSVDPLALQTLGLARVAAHCLYELTFWGFSESEVVAARRDLLERIAQLKGDEDKRDLFIPLSEALKEIRRDSDEPAD